MVASASESGMSSNERSTSSGVASVVLRRAAASTARSRTSLAGRVNGMSADARSTAADVSGTCPKLAGALPGDLVEQGRRRGGRVQARDVSPYRQLQAHVAPLEHEPVHALPFAADH